MLKARCKASAGLYSMGGPVWHKAEEGALQLHAAQVANAAVARQQLQIVFKHFLQAGASYARQTLRDRCPAAGSAFSV